MGATSPPPAAKANGALSQSVVSTRTTFCTTDFILSSFQIVRTVKRCYPKTEMACDKVSHLLKIEHGLARAVPSGLAK
jgi:hypothetical protein